MTTRQHWWEKLARSKIIWTWLRKRNLKREKLNFSLIAAQNNAIRSNYVKAKLILNSNSLSFISLWYRFLGVLLYIGEGTILGFKQEAIRNYQYLVYLHICTILVIQSMPVHFIDVHLSYKVTVGWTHF